MRSRIACACNCERPNCFIRPERAVSASFDLRIRLDHGVEVFERGQQAVEDVQTRLGFLQLETGAPREHDFAMLEKRDEHLEQGHLLGPAFVDAEQDDAVALLHLGELVELVEDDAWFGVALELDDDAHAVAIGLVANVADAFDALVVDQLDDALDQPRLLHLVGNLGDDDLPRATCDNFSLLPLGAQAQRAASGLVCPATIVERSTWSGCRPWGNRDRASGRPVP